MNFASQSNFPALTGIRFPLALWVIAYHVSSPGLMWEDLFTTPAVQAAMSRAYVALGTFFALSGFLIAHTYRDSLWDRSSVARYSVYRAARILPLYYFSLLAIAPIILQQLQNRPELVRPDILASHAFLLQGWKRPPVDWNTPAWSLSCEIFFYGMFPFLAALLPRERSRRAWLLTAAAFIVPVLVRVTGPMSDLKPLVYLGDFLVGLACAEWIGSRHVTRFRERGYVFYLPGVVAAVWLVFRGGWLPWLAFDELMRVANAAVILGLALGGGALHAFLSSRALVAAGAASFAIYILHIPALWWFRRYANMGIADDIKAGVVYFLIVIAVSLVVSRVVEFPANRMIRGAYEWVRARRERARAEEPEEEVIEAVR